MHEQEKFYYLLAMVCRKMPRYAVDLAISAGYGAEYGATVQRRLYNVKQGKVVNLPDLVALVRHSLPDFEIPSHLLPDAQPVPVTA
jgi:hypothetical protein